VAQRLAEGGPVGGAVGGQHGAQMAAGAEERPVVAQIGMVTGQQVGEDGAVAGGAHGQPHVAQAADANRLLDDFGRPPLAVDLVARRVVRVEALDIYVLDVGEGVGDAPGAVVVVADDDAGHAGQGEAADVVVAAVQMDGVPDGREDGRQVGVIGQLRPAALCARPSDDPVVAAQAPADEGQADWAVGHRLAESANQPLGQAATDALIGQRRGVVGAVDGGHVGGALRAEFVQQPGAQQFRLPVARQPPGQHRPPGAGAQRVPRLRAIGQNAELGRQRAGGDKGVDAGAIGVNGGAGRRVAAVHLGLRRARPGQGARELVEGHPQRAGDFGQPPQPQTAVEVHLEEAILGLHKALGEEEVVIVSGVDVGYAPLVADDLHRRAQTVEDGAAVGPGHRAAHEAAGGDGSAERAGRGGDRQSQPLAAGGTIRRVP